MSDIDRMGIGNVMDETIAYFASRDMNIHCSYDIDAIGGWVCGCECGGGCG